MTPDLVDQLTAQRETVHGAAYRAMSRAISEIKQLRDKIERLSAAQDDEPVAWVSPGQFEALRDPDAGEGGGAYLPVRKSTAGNFTMPLYARPQVKPAPVDADLREAAREAAFKAIYGPNADPFSNPEGEAFCSGVADAILRLIASKSVPADHVSDAPKMVPDGWVMAPLEPVNAMVIAGATAVNPNIVDCPDDAHPAEVEMRDHVLMEARETYRAMIAKACDLRAAPQSGEGE